MTRDEILGVILLKFKPVGVRSKENTFNFVPGESSHATFIINKFYQEQTSKRYTLVPVGLSEKSAVAITRLLALNQTINRLIDFNDRTEDDKPLTIPGPIPLTVRGRIWKSQFRIIAEALLYQHLLGETWTRFCGDLEGALPPVPETEDLNEIEKYFEFVYDFHKYKTVVRSIIFRADCLPEVRAIEGLDELDPEPASGPGMG